MNTARILYKSLFAVVAITGVVLGIQHQINDGTYVPANFFSWFTIEMNIISAVMLVIGIIGILRGWTTKLASVRGAVAANILLVAIGNFVFLSGLLDGDFSFGALDNILLHYITPLAMLLDLFVTPLGRKLHFIKSLWWITPTAIFLVYSYLRGPIVHWYPYPFLDPGVTDLTHIIMNIGELFVALLLLILAICYVSRFHSKATRINA